MEELKDRFRHSFSQDYDFLWKQMKDPKIVHAQQALEQRRLEMEQMRRLWTTTETSGIGKEFTSLSINF
jgi:hypothetical protein